MILANKNRAANRLLSAFPAIMCYWYKFSHDGVEIDCTSDEASLGGHFLRLLNGTSPSGTARTCYGCIINFICRA